MHDSIQCSAWHTERVQSGEFLSFPHLPQGVSQTLLHLWLDLTQLEWLLRGLQSESKLLVTRQGACTEPHPYATWHRLAHMVGRGPYWTLQY